jgi:ABC-type multidrug transport system ATPase subunit
VRIELRAVTRRFGRLTALADLSLEIPAGRKVALIGPNGSGKSTLTRVLMGMLSCEGEVRIDGRSPFREREGLAQRLAYVPQAAPQLGATVSEIVSAISCVRGLRPQAVATTAAALGLDLGAVASTSVRALSGGMKQKLLLALAFAADAGLLLLDEPTASLDAASRAAFYRLVEERAGGATLLLCSHRLEEVRHLVDHVVALEEGRLAWQGPLGDYLRGSAHSVIEVQAGALEAGAWLRARGFIPGAAGGWARVVARSESVVLLRELLGSQNGGIEAVQVRDLESIDGTFVPTGAP